MQSKQIVVPKNSFQNSLNSSSFKVLDESDSFLNKKLNRIEDESQTQKTVKKQKPSNDIQEYTVPLNYVRKQLSYAEKSSIVRIICNDIQLNYCFQKFVF